MKCKKYQITKEIDQLEKARKEPKRRFLWKGIPEGSVGIISGVAKTGKTTFMENLAISLAVGRTEFFGGKLTGEPQKVLFINLEESYEQRTFRRDKQLESLNQDELERYKENFYTTPENFPEFIDNEDDWRDLSAFIDDCKPQVLAFDSLTHLFRGSIEKSSECRDFIKKFNQYVKRPGLTVIVIHHNTKGNTRPIDQDCVAGSRVITAFFQFSYGLANIPTRHGGNYACMLNNKFIPKDDTTAYLYKVNENGWFELIDEVNKYDLYNESSPKIDYRYDSTNRDKILKFIENQDNPITTTAELKEKFVLSGEMSGDTLHTSLNKLVDDHKIEKERKGEYILVKGSKESRMESMKGGGDE